MTCVLCLVSRFINLELDYLRSLLLYISLAFFIYIKSLDNLKATLDNNFFLDFKIHFCFTKLLKNGEFTVKY